MGVAPPPYRIETDRLVIRCWEPRDAPLLADAVNSSLDHLRPWMPWAREPVTVDQEVELLRGFRGRFDLGEDFVLGVFDRDETQVLGGSGLHTRVGDDAYEIGYWIRASATGQGIAGEVAAVLTRVAFELCEADRVEIHVEPANVRSLAVPRRLGFTAEATLRRRLPPREEGAPRLDMTVFTLLREDLAGTPCADAPLRAAADAAGRPLPL